MKRHISLIILLGIVANVFAQWNTDFNIEGKCSHARHDNQKQVLLPNYNWQSDYLFDYDVTSYILDIEVTDTSTYIIGNAIINAKALVTLDTFAFELIPEQNISVILFNGEQIENYYREDDNVIVPVNEVEAGSNITARIYYSGKPPEGGFFSGVTNSFSDGWQKHVTWTLSEPFSAKDWFPVKQDLQDKADSAILYFTTSSSNMVGSQGLLTNVVDVGDNKLRYEWKTNYPIDYYLISFAVADYTDYSIYAHPEQMGEDSLLIQNFLYNDPANVEMKKESLDKTKDIMELYSNLFTLYPFYEEKYGHCETQLGGGMEHQTMSTMGNFSFHLIAHELGHMWFGDNVTCATWSDIWINEGFATYSDYLANEFLLGNEAAQTFIVGAQDHAMSEDYGSVYIPESSITPGNEWRIFNGRLSYDKGASIIHMLRHEIQNDELFIEILQTFQDDFGGGTATGDDFKLVAEDVTGLNLDYFFNQWYYGEGYPIYSFVYWMDIDNIFHLSSTQTTSNYNTTLFNMLLDFRLHFNDGSDTVVSYFQTEDLSLFSGNFGKRVVSIDVDPYNWTMEKVANISFTDENNISSLYFTIGPNPVENTLNIYFHKPDTVTRNIVIQNTQGQIVFNEETDEHNIVLDASSFESGVYFVTIMDGSASKTNKFVIL